MSHRLPRLVLLALVCVGTLCLSPAQALAARAANYGCDWSGYPWYSQDLFDGAVRSAYYQQLDGFTTMDRDRCKAIDIWRKISDQDLTGYKYEVINVLSHGAPPRIVVRPKDGEGYCSCLYEDIDGYYPTHTHTINGHTITCAQCSRVNNITSVPTCRWIMLQACNTAYESTPTDRNIVEQCFIEGVDTAVGFKSTIDIGGNGTNFKTYQYNFSAKYWKSLQEGAYNSDALDDGAAQVLYFHWDYHGYNNHRYYGGDTRL